MSYCLTRRQFNQLLLASGVGTVALPSLLGEQPRPESPSALSHPGMLHSRSDLARMRASVLDRSGVIYAGFEKLRDHPQSQLTYRRSGALVEVGRNPGIFQGFDNDCNAAYQTAVMWCVTEDTAYAQLAIAILNDWSATLQRITGADAVLCASLGGFKLANAAELLRNTHAGWKTADADRGGRMLHDVFLPVILDFAPFANGNWDTAALKLMLSVAIYLDDRDLWSRALVYYLHGCGDGQLAHYIYANEQCQESGRDQQHTQLGLAHMGDCCEMAWHQGLDLYGALDNRLLQGFEYTASYNLGAFVAFQPDIDQTGKYRHSVISPRGPLRPIYEQIYNHYVHRRGLPAPWTAKAAATLRPEGAAFQADHPGFGTFFYTRPSDTEPPSALPSSAPAALFVEPANEGLTLYWLPLRNEDTYTLERAEESEASFHTVARSLSGASFTDQTARPGHLYKYRVRTSRQHTSLPVQAVAALPPGWAVDSVLEGALPGFALFDGNTWRLSAAAGSTPLELGGGAFFIHTPLSRDGIFTARLLPLFASQALRVGIALRSNTDPATRCVLLVSPGLTATPPVERSRWAVSLLQGTAATAGVEVKGATLLPPPITSYGRIVQPVWLRLQRVGRTIDAGYSADGHTWSEIGRTELPQDSMRIGLILSSGLPQVTTAVLLDHVTSTANGNLA